MMRSACLPVLCIALSAGKAQDMAPLITASDRFVIFDHGKFKEIEPRKPQQVVTAGDRIVYVDDQGLLRIISERTATTVERDGPFTLIGSAGLVAFTRGTRLGIARATGSLILSEDAGDVSVSDSLIAYHDRSSGTLNVCWRNNIVPVASIAQDSERPQWQLGRNTFTCFDHGARTIQLVYRGRITELCDSSDMAVVSCGGDIVAYFDGGSRSFRVMDHGSTKTLEEFRPIDFQAGDGVVAYTDVGLAFNVYRDGISRKVLDHMPTKYWVRDSTVIFVDQGSFWTEEKGVATVVESYVPEQWSIHQGRIVYLDLNREIQSYHHGARDKLSRGEARIERFEHHGNAVTYRDQLGLLKVAWKGRLFEY